MKPEDVIKIYDAVGTEFAAHRKGLTERKWLDRFFALMPRYDAAGNVARRVLDVGAGAGRPIAGYLTDRGATVTALDASVTMLGLFQQNFPKLRVLQQDMRRIEASEEFDGLIAWDSFFHLSPEDQRSTLPRLARALSPHGVMLLTTGPEAGIAIGKIGETPIYHASLAPEEYRSIFEAAMLDVMAYSPEDPEATGHTIWLLRKQPN